MERKFPHPDPMAIMLDWHNTIEQMGIVPTNHMQCLDKLLHNGF
jgi:hypothetical protein